MYESLGISDLWILRVGLIARVTSVRDKCESYLFDASNVPTL